MPQRCFSYVIWTFRLFALIAALLQPGDGVAQGPLTLLTEPTGAGCGMSNGTIFASATGGSPPYYFQLNGGAPQASGFFVNLPAGPDVVTVIDQTTSTSNFVIISSGCLTIQTDVETATCGNANGTVTVNVVGGMMPYVYAIDTIGYTGGIFNYQTTNVFNNIAGGTYMVIVMDLAGNITTALVQVGDIQGPTISSITVGPASCLNDDGTVTVNTIGGTIPLFYSINSGPFGDQAQIGGVASGTDTITVVDDNHCLATATTTVPLVDNLTLTMGTVPIICQGTSTTLLVNSNAAFYAWTPADGLSNAAIADPIAEPQTTTTYSLTAILGICTLTGSETVTVLPAPVPDAGAPDTTCPGKSVQLEGSGGVQYQWSPATYLSDPATADPIVEQPAASITYSLTVLGANGCTSVQPATVKVFVTPPPAVFAGDDTAVLAGQPVPLDAIDVSNSGFTQYTWSPASGLNNAAVQDPIAQITGDITYTVVATTANGCTGTGSIVIVVVPNSTIVVPNAFTPNGDGRNDVLRVDAIGIRDFKYFSVFNRWGQEVFTTSNQGIGWDGTRGGQLEPAGVYVWAAMGLDFSGKQVLRKGTVILIR
jgi:gliding motility-associated-like protein